MATYELDTGQKAEALRNTLFRNDTCLLCGHLEGDHEGPYDGLWYCDDDWCEDNDTCSPTDL